MVPGLITRWLHPAAGPALLLGAPAVSALAQPAGPDGERAFGRRCNACHAIKPGQTRPDPSLIGVYGRTAGTLEGARYSAALRGSGIVWNERTLDAYLAAPQEAVPGTTMKLSLRDEAERGAIITFLRARTPGP